MATIIQVQVRCAGCNRRLADIVNELQGGQVLIELKCPRCGQPHLEVIRPDAAHASSSASPPRRIGAGLGLILSIMSVSLWALPLMVAVLLVISVSAPHAVSASAESLAEVNGKTITSEQVQKALGARLATLERQIHQRATTLGSPAPRELRAGDRRGVAASQVIAGLEAIRPYWR